MFAVLLRVAALRSTGACSREVGHRLGLGIGFFSWSPVREPWSRGAEDEAWAYFTATAARMRRALCDVCRLLTAGFRRALDWVRTT